MLPFSSKQFLQVFGAFNLAIWPLQIVAYGVALLALVALLRSGQIANRVVAACLASMWLFTGIAYYCLHFARINPLADIFAATFLVEAALLKYTAARGFSSWRAADPVRTAIGAILVLYAAVAAGLIVTMRTDQPGTNRRFAGIRGGATKGRSLALPRSGLAPAGRLVAA